ncbi:hypothetical protein H696_01410 [Fonticula alba]|uniref:Magnesium transporter n=1 Tax=Fonticula alba TaxID=691883 RepID=A0A058ZDK3_FONAL|nr:hypothetical protein H696_01410 [Fonticula alba]KCV72003.1 hypothetical protein H696_01410 [Fonticula alba]|eukprot:XP_009493581.1 hypothetical protein H696_01410 [Fonticula alba]
MTPPSPPLHPPPAAPPLPPPFVVRSHNVSINAAPEDGRHLLSSEYDDWHSSSDIPTGSSSAATSPLPPHMSPSSSPPPPAPVEGAMPVPVSPRPQGSGDPMAGSPPFPVASPASRGHPHIPMSTLSPPPEAAAGDPVPQVAGFPMPADGPADQPAAPLSTTNQLLQYHHSMLVMRDRLDREEERVLQSLDAAALEDDTRLPDPFVPNPVALEALHNLPSPGPLSGGRSRSSSHIYDDLAPGRVSRSGSLRMSSSNAAAAAAAAAAAEREHEREVARQVRRRLRATQHHHHHHQGQESDGGSSSSDGDSDGDFSSDDGISSSSAGQVRLPGGLFGTGHGYNPGDPYAPGPLSGPVHSVPMPADRRPASVSFDTPSSSVADPPLTSLARVPSSAGARYLRRSVSRSSTSHSAAAAAAVAATLSPGGYHPLLQQDPDYHDGYQTAAYATNHHDSAPDLHEHMSRTSSLRRSRSGPSSGPGGITTINAELHNTIDPYSTTSEPKGDLNDVVIMPQEAIGKVRLSQLNHFIFQSNIGYSDDPNYLPPFDDAHGADMGVTTMDGVAPPSGSWIPFRDIPTTFKEDALPADTRFTFFQPRHGVLLADELAGLRSSILYQAIREGTFWLDVYQATSAEMSTIAEIFGIHPLTIEDIHVGESREKVEFYDGYAFISINALEGRGIETDSVYLVVCEQYVMSFRKSATALPSWVVLDRLFRMSQRVQLTSSWILWAMLDHIVDAYIPVVKQLEGVCEDIDHLVMYLKETEHSDMLWRISNSFKSVGQFRRLLSSKTELFKVLLSAGRRGGTALRFTLAHDTTLYIMDIHDHVISMSQMLSQFSTGLKRSRETYVSKIDVELALASNQMNRIVKTLTGVTAIVLPLSLWSGIWGMNVPVPGEENDNAFMIMMISMGLTALLMTVIGLKFNWF